MIFYGIEYYERNLRHLLCPALTSTGYGLFPIDFVYSYIIHPVMSSSAYEIDNLMQKFMSEYNSYSVKVCIFTEEETEFFLLRKLKG